MINIIKKLNPSNYKKDRIDKVLTLLFNAYAYNNFDDFTEAKIYLNQGEDCEDCFKKYNKCECDYCPECNFKKCLCDITKENFRKEVMKFAREKLSRKDFNEFKDILIDARDNYKQDIPKKL